MSCPLEYVSQIPRSQQLPAHQSAAGSRLLEGTVLQSGAEAAGHDGRFCCLQFQKADLVVLARAEKEGHHVLGRLLSLVFSITLKRSKNYKAECDMMGRKKS